MTTDITVGIAALLDQLRRGLPAPLSCRLLDKADADRLTDFRARIVAGLPDPDFYRMAGESGDFVRDHLSGPDGGGVVAGVFDQSGEMAAYGALGLPQPGMLNRGEQLGLPVGELPLVAHISSAMVRPDWHGNGLHHRLLDWRISVAALSGRRHLLTTVSPRNHQSWGHLAAHGILAKRLIDVGGGLIRLLVHRDLTRAPQAVADLAAHRRIAVERLADQSALFDAGCWLWRRERQGDAVFAVLAPPINSD